MTDRPATDGTTEQELPLLDGSSLNLWRKGAVREERAVFSDLLSLVEMLSIEQKKAVNRAAGLEGYRELCQRAAAAENERDDAIAKLRASKKNARDLLEMVNDATGRSTQRGLEVDLLTQQRDAALSAQQSAERELDRVRRIEEAAGKAVKLRTRVAELESENRELRAREARISDTLWGVPPLDPEHTLHSHKEDVPAYFLAMAKGIDEARRILSDAVLERLEKPLVTDEPPAAGKSAAVPYERPEVLWFAEKMEKKLRDNDHKGHWSRCDFPYLDRRLDEEVSELKTARSHLKRGASATVARVIAEAADVANFAMMIADNARALDSPPEDPSAILVNALKGSPPSDRAGCTCKRCEACGGKGAWFHPGSTVAGGPCLSCRSKGFVFNEDCPEHGVKPEARSDAIERLACAVADAWAPIAKEWREFKARDAERFLRDNGVPDDRVALAKYYDSKHTPELCNLLDALEAATRESPLRKVRQ